MPRYRFDIQQNTEEWEAIKVGKFSASSADKLLTDKSNKGYIQLVDRMVEEKITGQPTESKVFSGNQFTDRGHELEPVARNDYELSYFTDIELVGVVEKDEWVLCSPDGLINEDELWQAKCPIFNTQKSYLKKANALKKEGKTDNEILLKIDSKYYKQMQFELFVSERKRNIFYSYHPHLSAVKLIIERDENVIKEIETRLSEAIEEVKNEIKLIKSL